MCLCLFVCICLCVCLFVCLCVWMGEREREKKYNRGVMMCYNVNNINWDVNSSLPKLVLLLRRVCNAPQVTFVPNWYN